MSCHVDADGTDNSGGNKLHQPEETGMDGAYAARTANKAYRPRRCARCGNAPPYFHDGSAATLADVVVHYNPARRLNVTAERQRELEEYLKTL